MQRVADLRDVLRFRWVVAVGRVTDETIPRADRKYDLREVRRECDHAIDALRNTHHTARIVRKLYGRRGGALHWRAHRRTRKRRHEQQRPEKDHEPSELN